MVRRRWIAVAVAVLAALASVLVVEVPGPADAGTGGTARTGTSDSVAVRSSVPPPSAYCRRSSRRAFTPTSVRIPRITRSARVLALPRHGAARIRSAPVTAEGAREFAWDAPRPRPGSRHGHVLLNAHTWPWSDPIALGNAMLRRLHVGHLVVVRGVRDGHRAHLCYRVVRQVEIRADQRYDRYYARAGAPRLAFMVCSGRRRGRGDWDHRMIWFTQPYGVQRPHRAAPATATPDPGSAPSQSPPPLIVLPPLLGG
ncbi:MAG: class F sortase [Marmoricola sp.]